MLLNPISRIKVVYDQSISSWQVHHFSGDKCISIIAYKSMKDAVSHAMFDVKFFENKFSKKPVLDIYEKYGKLSRFSTPKDWRKKTDSLWSNFIKGESK